MFNENFVVAITCWRIFFGNVVYSAHMMSNLPDMATYIIIVLLNSEPGH